MEQNQTAQAIEPSECPNDANCKQWRQWVTKSLEEGTQKFDSHQKAIEENTTITLQVKGAIDKNANDLSELLDLFKGAKTGVKAVNRFGSWLIWIGKQAPWLLSLGGLIYFLKTGHWPKAGGE